MPGPRPQAAREMTSTVAWAFQDALLALEETDQKEVADRLRIRWPEASIERRRNGEDPQPTKGKGSSSVGS